MGECDLLAWDNGSVQNIRFHNLADDKNTTAFILTFKAVGKYIWSETLGS